MAPVAKKSIILKELEQQNHQFTHRAPYYAYLRVSSDEQKKKKTIDSQRIDVEAWAKSRGVKLTAVLKDDGLSGTDIAGRPDFTKLLQLLRDGKVGTLIVTAPDRLTRAEDWNDRAQIMTALKAHRTMLAMTSFGDFDPCAETADLMFGNFFTMASMERKRIRARSFSGKARAVENGRLPSGRPPFGREYNRQTGTWSVNESEIEIYRRMFRLCLDGTSARQIAETLSRENIPSPGGKGLWRSSTVLAMLRHRSAIGEYNALGTTIQIPNIIDEATFKAVDARLTAARASHGAPTHKPRLLSGLMTCGACGAGIHVKTGGRGAAQYYVCGTAHSVHKSKPGFVKPQCGSIYHRADDVDALVWQEVERLLTNPQQLQRAAGLGRDAGTTDEKEIGTSEKELQNLERQQQNLMRLFRKGLADEGDLEKQMQEVQRARKAATDRLNVALARKATVGAMKAMSQDMAERVKVLAASLNSAATVEQKKAFARVIFPKLGGLGIRLFPDSQIEAVGTLGDQLPTSSRRTGHLVDKAISFRLKVKVAPKGHRRTRRGRS